MLNAKNTKIAAVIIIMDQNSSTHFFLSLDTPIDELGLGLRPLNALKRADIHSIRDLVETIETGRLDAVRNIGHMSRIWIISLLTVFPLNRLLFWIKRIRLRIEQTSSQKVW